MGKRRHSSALSTVLIFSSIALWSVSKRRPLFNLPRAHKETSVDPSLVPSSLPEEFWITSLASLRYTDLLASGSFNGHIHLWKSTAEFNHLSLLFTLPQVSADGSLKYFTQFCAHSFRLDLSMISSFPPMETTCLWPLARNIDWAAGGRWNQRRMLFWSINSTKHRSRIRKMFFFHSCCFAVCWCFFLFCYFVSLEHKRSIG